MRKIKNISILILLTAAFFLQGCVSNLLPLQTEEASLGKPTKINKELKSLPAPKDKIVAAVYKFRDQTGQYKPTETGSSWSTAVTQGATSILIKALEESGWFIPIEREGLSNLLNERKIIRSSRANYTAQSGDGSDLLPPLLFAGVILEGGIVSYETNIMTGGAGAKYFGVGGSSHYRQDRVTIYLRAISTSNGRILKTVYTSKTILSQLVDVGLFKFVDVKKLVEVETGYSYNEPPEMCVTEAIEKAVQAMVVEGIIDGLWELQDSSQISSQPIREYLTEKNELGNEDFFSMNYNEKRRTKLSISLEAGAQRYEGDYGNPDINSKLGGSINYGFTNNLQIGIEGGYGKITNPNTFDSKMWNVGLFGSYYFLRENQISPYIKTGAGIARSTLNQRYKISEEKTNPYIFGGVGIEYMPIEFLGLSLELQNRYIIGDDIDGSESGKLNDYFWTTSFALKFYPGL